MMMCYFQAESLPAGTVVRREGDKCELTHDGRQLYAKCDPQADNFYFGVVGFNSMLAHLAPDQNEAFMTLIQWQIPFEVK